MADDDFPIETAPAPPHPVDVPSLQNQIAALFQIPTAMLFPLKRARGRYLDDLARVYGLRRKRWFWIFRERDKTLRARIERANQELRARPCPIA